eukprot:TRINITY_DN1424_c0_g2_i2.p1 TRINITY_DN1424_c0_g2~~TRINITY_DN1424_c0_g2_i2.p1  ORF type:complete len:112 (+),score=1.40 TRINITY_DN1424_c0_g2_i2:97-432(+)
MRGAIRHYLASMGAIFTRALCFAFSKGRGVAEAGTEGGGGHQEAFFLQTPPGAPETPPWPSRQDWVRISQLQRLHTLLSEHSRESQQEWNRTSNQFLACPAQIDVPFDDIL